MQQLAEHQKLDTERGREEGKRDKAVPRSVSGIHRFRLDDQSRFKHPAGDCFIAIFFLPFID